MGTDESGAIVSYDCVNGITYIGKSSMRDFKGIGLSYDKVNLSPWCNGSTAYYVGPGCKRDYEAACLKLYNDLILFEGESRGTDWKIEREGLVLPRNTIIVPHLLQIIGEKPEWEKR